jgi:hypothetical protein
MEKSIFLEREGYAPKSKVLDFLIVSQDFDYSLKDIAKFSRISYPCMKQLKNDLVKNKWIVQTRAVGKAKMFKLNLKSEKVKTFIDFYWSVVEEEVDKQLGIKKEEKHYSTGRAALPASAHHF